jgi:hypothetical protein
MFTKLLSCVALAATFALPQAAPACPCGCHSAPAAVQNALGAAPAQPAVTPHHAPVAAGPAAAAQPPVATGTGRVIRRFSYEPGTAAAPQAAVAPAAMPAFRPAEPMMRTGQPARLSQPARMGQSVGGLTGEARLHPGRVR